MQGEGQRLELTGRFECAIPPVWDGVGEGARLLVLGGRHCRPPSQTLRQAILGTRNPGCRWEGQLGSWLWWQVSDRMGLVLVLGGDTVGISLDMATLEGAVWGVWLRRDYSENSFSFFKYPVYISSMCFLTRFRGGRGEPWFSQGPCAS